MGLQCSILGHAFEDAGVEREREEQGSEVVTTEREIERCRRCGAERVVAENTEVTAVVDGDAVGLEPEAEAEETPADESGDAIGSALERSDAETSESGGLDVGGAAAPTSTADEESGVEESPTAGDEWETSESGVGGEETPDPETEDAEILTDDGDDGGSERAPGQWPEEDGGDESEDAERVVETDTAAEGADEESLSGITVPEGWIVCPECGFQAEAQSGYREGDSCPECNAWLEAERNQ
jgi:hypothetical protein